MKHIFKIRNSLFLIFSSVLCYNAAAQGDSTQPEISVTIHHLSVNNNFQYLLIDTKTKIAKKWLPLKGQVLQLYLDSNKAENLITKVQTDSDGKARAVIPVALKSLWDASSAHKFIAVTEGTSKDEETTTETEINKARILMDTANADGVRGVNVQVMARQGNDWIPVKGVDVKIGVNRMGGDLRIGEEETYTTDSLGHVTGEFKLDSLPGDKNGNLTLAAKVEDNDKYGSLSIEKVVPWGLRSQPVNNFGQRTLWAARGKAPIWLMFMAYSIIAAVWGVILYLILQIIKMKKIGGRKIVQESENRVLTIQE